MTIVSFLASVTAVLGVVALVHRLGLGRPAELDAATAIRIADEALFGHRFGAATVDAERRAALVEGENGEVALVRAHGAKLIARLLAPPVKVDVDGDRLIVDPSEFMLGATSLTLGAEEAGRWAEKLAGTRHA